MNTSTSKTSRYSVFKISGVYFALEITNIKEVLNQPVLTRLPNSDSHYSGIFNLRGKIITLIDIRPLLNLEKTDSDVRGMAIIMEYDQYHIAVKVDELMDFLNIDEIKIQLPSRKTPSAIANYVIGLIHKENLGDVYILDIVKLIRVLRPL